MISLNIGDNLITGTVPSTFTQLSALQEFVAPFTRLEGPIFDIVLHWKHLRALRLRETLLTGTLPPEVAGLTNLQELKIASTLFHSSIPTEIMSLPMLQDLLVTGPNWDSTIPTEIGNLSLLRESNSVLSWNCDKVISRSPYWSSMYFWLS